MKKLPLYVLLLLAPILPLLGEDLGTTWLKGQDDSGNPWVESAGVLPPRPSGIIVGPAAEPASILFDGQMVQSGGPLLPRAAPARYHGYALPEVSAGTHTVRVILRRPDEPSVPPLLAVVAQEGLAARVALLNLPLEPLPIFAGLLSVLLAVQFAILGLRQRSRETLFLAAALLAGSASCLVTGFFATFMDRAMVGKAELISLFVMCCFLTLAFLELLKSFRLRLFFPFVIPPFLAVFVVGAAATSSLAFYAGLAERALLCASFVALALLCLRSVLRARLSEGNPAHGSFRGPGVVLCRQRAG